MFKRLKTYSDNELVTLVKQGKSDKALGYLYKITQPKITAWIVQNKGSKEEAQDIFQDSIVAFYNYVLTNKFEVGNTVEGFIFSVAKNKWINRAKQQKKIIALSSETTYLEEESNQDNSDIKNIEALLEQLGAICKELLTYSVFYKMSMEDIALRMEYSSADAVKTKNYKCKQRLVKLVKDKENLKNLLYNE